MGKWHRFQIFERTSMSSGQHSSQRDKRDRSRRVLTHGTRRATNSKRKRVLNTGVKYNKARRVERIGSTF